MIDARFRFRHYQLALPFLAAQSIPAGIPVLGSCWGYGWALQRGVNLLSVLFLRRQSAWLWSAALGNRLCLVEAVGIFSAGPDQAA